MNATDQDSRTTALDAETASLLIEAASIVGRPLQASLRYKLMLRARAFQLRELPVSAA